MNKSYFSLGILLFASLHISTTLGMEENYISHYTKQLPIELKYHIIIKLKQSESSQDKSNMRLVNKYFAQEGANAPKTWTPMPNKIEKAYDRLFSPKSTTTLKNNNHYYISCKKMAPKLILAKIISENYEMLSEDIEWLYSNSPLASTIRSFYAISESDDADLVSHKINCQFYYDPYGPFKLVKHYNNEQAGEVLIKNYLKVYNYSQEFINTSWQKIYQNIPAIEHKPNLLPENECENVIELYEINALNNDLNDLKKLWFQVEPTNDGKIELIYHCFDKPELFEFIFTKYKESSSIPESNKLILHCLKITGRGFQVSDKVIEYLKQQRKISMPSSCPIQ